MGPCRNLSFFECRVLSQPSCFSFFTFIKMPFSSLSLSAIRMVSSSYLRLLILLLEILIPACDSSSLAFCMLYSAYKLNKQTIYSFVLLLSQFWTSPLFHIGLQLLILDQRMSPLMWYFGKDRITGIENESVLRCVGGGENRIPWVMELFYNLIVRVFQTLSLCQNW